MGSSGRARSQPRSTRPGSTTSFEENSEQLVSFRLATNLQITLSGLSCTERDLYRPGFVRLSADSWAIPSRLYNLSIELETIAFSLELRLGVMSCISFFHALCIWAASRGHCQLCAEY